MFPTRYFNPRYWAKRFWPKVGATSSIPLGVVSQSKGTAFLIPNFSAGSLVPLIVANGVYLIPNASPPAVPVNINGKAITRVSAKISGSDVNAKMSGTRVSAKMSGTRVK